MAITAKDQERRAKEEVIREIANVVSKDTDFSEVLRKLPSHVANEASAVTFGRFYELHVMLLEIMRGCSGWESLLLSFLRWLPDDGNLLLKERFDTL